MKILFKQFFKTFKKNFFLIFGLTALMMALSFLVSTSINISVSFSSALNNLNNKGNLSQVVSNIPNDFGYLDFSYKPLVSSEPYNVFSSSLNIQYNQKTGIFSRAANTFFPYDKDKLDSRDKKFGVNSGITVNQNGTDANDLFNFNLNDPNASWNYNYGLTVDKPLGPGLFEKRSDYALAWSFADDNNEVIFDPKTFVFNSYGIPIAYFSKGTLYNEPSLLATFNNRNKAVINKYPKIYDETGLGITTEFFNRSDKKVYSLHNINYDFAFYPEDYNLWYASDSYLFEIFSHFLEVKSVVPYSFEINLDNSSGPIKEFLIANPSYFKKAFDKIFYGNNVSREKIPGNFTNVHSNIELVQKADSTYQINLGVDDEIFVDYSQIRLDPNKVDAMGAKIPLDVQLQEAKKKQLDINKKIYLNNFAGFLSSKITSTLNDLFLEEAKNHFNKNDIKIEEQSEYYYLDNKTGHEFLFVGKDNDGINDISINSGSNLLVNDTPEKIISMLSSTINGLRTTSTFYAAKELFDLMPKSSYPKRPNKIPPEISNDYMWFNLLIHCLNKLVEQWDQTIGRNAILTSKDINNPYLLILIKLMNGMEVQLNGNLVEIKTILNISYTSLFIEAKYFISILSNYFAVINSSYALANEKKYLPTTVNKERLDTWTRKLTELNNNQNDFVQWLETIKGTELMVLSAQEIVEIFKENEIFFKLWSSALDDNYKISYQENTFLINGFGLSPEYSYPSISPTAPIPVPDTQAIIFLNKSTYNSLKISDINKFNYYAYGSSTLTNEQIINIVNDYSIKQLKSNIFNATNVYDATNMHQIWLRVTFPREVNNLIVLFSVIGSIALILLSFFVVYLLLNSFIKNMLEPIALCMGNGVPLYKIIIACMLNLGIITTFSTMAAYTISYFTQSSIISLFANIWYVPGTAIISFSPAIFIPLLVITFLVFAGILSWIVYRKFKKPIPQIIANKQDIKNSIVTNVLKNNRLRLTGLFKLTAGFSTINIGRLSLLSLLGAVALGGIVSTSIINEKFANSKIYTYNTSQYSYDYNFLNVYESTGLFKPQRFAEIGFEDKNVGINSIYLPKAEFDKTPNSQRYPYYKEQLMINEIPKGGNEKDIKPKQYVDTNGNVSYKYLSNFIYPSYKVYLEIFNNLIEAFFNGSASIFLLDVKVNFAGVLNINIWDFIKPKFPSWVVSQLEDQQLVFQNNIMEHYGEWYYKFTNNLDAAKILTNNADSLNITNIDKNLNSGIYYAKVKNKNIFTKPYYVWVDSDQTYLSSATLINQRVNAKTGDNVTLSFNRQNDFGKYNKNNEFIQEPVAESEAIEWRFVPAYNYDHEMDYKKTNNISGSVDPYNIRFSDNFLQFITTIYGDERVSSQDSKISFGVVPYDDKIDESYTSVEGNITEAYDGFGKKYNINDKVKVYGIKPNSEFVQLKDGNNQPIGNKLVASNNNTINVIINNGASLKYGLKVGSTFNLNVSNNSLSSAYNFVRDMINLVPDNLYNNTYTFKVVDISNDSFGVKFHINQEDANRMTGLDRMPVYSDVLPQIKTFYPNEQKNSFVPFNGIFSKNPELLISRQSIPFYTFANLWTIWTQTKEVTNIKEINLIFDSILPRYKESVLSLANSIKANINSSFQYDPNDPVTTRANILNFLNENYSTSSFLRTMNDSNNDYLLQSSLASCIPTAVTSEMFDMISQLTVTLIIILISIIIPLLIIVTLITSLSIVNDLAKNLGLMKILGYSNRNILLSFGLMYSLILIVTIILGLGIMFACTYGLQYLVFNLTSIFITSFVQPGTFFVGVGASVFIFALTIMFIAWTLKRKGIENSVKF